MNFKKFLIVTLIFISTLLLLIVYGIFHLISEDTIKKGRLKDYETAADTVISYLEKFIEEKQKDTDIIISILNSRKDTYSRHTEITNFLSVKGDIKHVLLTDSEGKVLDIIPFREDLIGLDMSNSRIFKRFGDSEFYGPYVTFLDHSPSYVILKHIGNNKLFLFIDIPGINTFVERLRRQDYYAFIIDSNGLVIFHVNEELVNQGMNLSHLKFIRDGLKQKVEKLIETSIDGEDYVLFVKRIPRTDYFFFVGQKRDIAYLSLYSLRENFIFLFIILIVFSLFISLLVSNRFNQPVVNIIEMIERIKRGDYRIPVVSSKIQELEKISRELHEMAQIIEDRELKLRKIFETTLDALVITTIDGKVLEFNEAAAKMFGFSSKEDVYEDLRVDSFYYHDLSDRNYVINKLLESGYIKNFEVTFKKIDGTLFYGLLSSTLVKDESDKILFIVSTIKDITDKRKLQEQLFQAQKMESIGRLAGSIAHDFNNILSVIQSSNQLIQMYTKDDPKIERYTSAITGAVNKARDFIRKLLAFSKRQVFVPKICDLNEVLVEEIKLLKPTIREDITLDLKTSDKPLYVNLDRTHFTQVLLNLTVNAMDAMPNGGQIVITTEEKRFEYEHIRNYPFMKEGVFAALNFSDTGTGIPEEVKERIFEPFFTTKPEGTGLGLSTVYSIVQQHGGFINVYSEYGKGTTFKIYFPLASAKAEIAHKNTEDIELAVKRILLVEDNDKLRDMTEEILRTNGFEVLSFSNGIEVIEKFDQIREQIDLCLFDVIMPKIGGLELYKRLKSIKPDLKVIFMTGYSDSLIQIQSLIEEGQQLIYKPFGITELKRKIRELFQ